MAQLDDKKIPTSETTNTKFLIPFPTGEIKIMMKSPAVNNREKALVAAHIIRNIGYALCTIARINMCGINCSYEITKDMAAKLAIIGDFEADGVVNEWQIQLTNNIPIRPFSSRQGANIGTTYTLQYKQLSDNIQTAAFDLFD
ncbi:hypothetical protein F-liban_438 [Faustovirus]|nr:hypothetical protein F-liban_438 [Faustovirus]SME65129.1 Hypothetical protein FSTVST1_428 [Faustovirus ST1]